jgi:type I restriction enzyme S subunit
MQQPLPPGWRRAPLADLVGDDGVFTDGDWVESKDQDPDGDVRLIQLADVGDGEYRDRSARFLTSKKAEQLRCTFLKAGDVLVARMPDPLGRACIFPGDRKPAVTVVDVCVVRPKGGAVTTKWLCHALNSPQVRVRVAGHQAGTTRKRISRSNLGTVDLNVPPLADQERLVAEIEKQFTRLDAGVETLKRLQAHLRRYRAAVLKAALSGALVATESALARASGRSFEDGSAALRRILADRAALHAASGSKRRYVPPEGPASNGGGGGPLADGWAWATVDQLSLVSSGGTPKGVEDRARSAGEIPWLKVGDMNKPGNEEVMDGSDAWLSAADANSLGMTVFPAGSIVFPKRGGAIATNKKRRLARPSCVDLNCMVLRPVPSVARYLWWWFQSIDLAALGDGSNVPQINHGDIAPLLVPLPPPKEQDRIVPEIERHTSLGGAVAVATSGAGAKAARLRSAILRSAFDGSLIR